MKKIPPSTSSPYTLATSIPGVKPLVYEDEVLELRRGDPDTVTLRRSPPHFKIDGGDVYEALEKAQSERQKVVLSIDPFKGNVLGVFEGPLSKWEPGS
jgi:hypothetical protein